MNVISFDQIVEGIDRQLSYLHKERWAQQYAELMDAMHTTTGEAQERTRQAMRDHYRVRHSPKSSRAALIEEAKLRYEGEPAVGMEI